MITIRERTFIWYSDDIVEWDGAWEESWNIKQQLFAQMMGWA